VKKIESPYFIFFCEKRKSVGIMKKISCVDFLLKKECFFCGVLFREYSFRDIVREKKEGKLINDESYVSSSECYKNVVKFFVSDLRRIGE
jgi:hypothetical protein